MGESSGEVVRLTFPDGHTQDWQTAEGVAMSAACLAEFMRICSKPAPVSVEIVETATPQLPYEETAVPTDAQAQLAE